MIRVERFVNQLMSSNCYIVVDDNSRHCLCIDPASEKSLREIQRIEENELTLDYIVLTHEHTDHTWGVNALIDKFPSVKVICSELCKKALPKEAKTYFQLYYDDPEYEYNVMRVDFTMEELNWTLEWVDHNIRFIATPGHSPGSVCVIIDDLIFGGDTLMPFKPFIKKRNGGSLGEYQNSLSYIDKSFTPSTIVYPGHGDCMKLGEIIMFIDNIFKSN